MEAAASPRVISWIKASGKPKGVSMARVTGPDSGDTLLPHKLNRAAIHSILVEQLLMRSRRLPPPRSTDDRIVVIENHDGIATVLVLVAVPTTDIPADEPSPITIDDDNNPFRNYGIESLYSHRSQSGILLEMSYHYEHRIYLTYCHAYQTPPDTLAHTLA